MGLNAAIPKSGPAKKDDKAPEGIKYGKKEKADRLAPVDGSTEHEHHFPSAVQVDDGKKEPKGKSHTCEGKEDGFGV